MNRPLRTDLDIRQGVLDIPNDRRKPKVLFLCTGNSCRSQMAEGWAHALWGDRIDACSAGIETHGLNPNAVKVMAEAGVDIDEKMDCYRQVRDEIQAFVKALPEQLVG